MKRVYDPPAPQDGTRLLVDRLWPCGISRKGWNLDAWIQVSPSDALRRWFQHDPRRWPEFERRYFEELDSRSESRRPILEAVRRGTVTLLFSARDSERNNAIALRAYLEAKRKRPRRHRAARGR